MRLLWLVGTMIHDPSKDCLVITDLVNPVSVCVCTYVYVYVHVRVWQTSSDMPQFSGSLCCAFADERYFVLVGRLHRRRRGPWIHHGFIRLGHLGFDLVHLDSSSAGIRPGADKSRSRKSKPKELHRYRG